MECSFGVVRNLETGESREKEPETSVKLEKK